MRRSRLAAAALAAATVVIATGCDDDGDKAPAAKPVGLVSGGSTVQFADCDDWNRGSAEERKATVEALRGQLTPQRSSTAASPLPDDRAYATFDKTCANKASSSLRLYKLYVRMQGFAPLQD